MDNRVKKIEAPNKIINILYSSNFGTSMLIATTLIEGFYAFVLFSLTGKLTFGNVIVVIVALCYAFVMSGSVVFFTLRKNRWMVYSVVIFELLANYFLDYLTILQSEHNNRIVFFLAQLLIGTLCPLATKAFADEISKKEVQRIIEKK